jgi:hypothetical protein
VTVTAVVNERVTEIVLAALYEPSDVEAETADTVGAATYVKPLTEVPNPPSLVTTTFSAPAVFSGVVAEILVVELTVNVMALVPPNVTAVAPVKFVPVMVTTVPPANFPAEGEIEVIVGGEAVGIPLIVFEAVPPPAEFTALICIG